jgi:ribosomal protein L11 methyltransferase
LSPLAGPLVRLGIRVRADRAEVALAQLLPVLGAGAEEREVDGDVEYSLYAPAGELPRLEDIRALLGDALVDIVSEPVPEDWERRWHEFLRPVRVGSLVVRPPWVDGDPGDLVIDPGVFFGAGTHPTTQLCLRLLQELPAGGALCDWGAGTGVLAIAAARLGWEPVTAVEIEPGALELISMNAAANHVAVTTRWLDLTAAPAPWTPVVVANLPRTVLSQVLIERPPERMIASGLLVDEVHEIASAFGMREERRIVDGEWAGVVLR